MSEQESKPSFKEVNINQMAQRVGSAPPTVVPKAPPPAEGEVDVTATVMDPESVENAKREFAKVARELREKKLKNVYIEANTSQGAALMNISVKETVITMQSPRHVFSCNHATADCLYDGQPAQFGVIQKFQAISAEISNKAKAGQAKTKMIREQG